VLVSPRRFASKGLFLCLNEINIRAVESIGNKRYNIIIF